MGLYELAAIHLGNGAVVEAQVAIDAMAASRHSAAPIRRWRM
jgi:hypothetical protein